MSNITRETVEKAARLAQIKIYETEMDEMINGLQTITASADKLSKVDTTGIAPSEHSIEITNVLREDVVQPSFAREEMLANAPSRDELGFTVPKMVE